MHKHTNALIAETSPYLLQHAHNPVNWIAYSPAIFERAKQEQKLVLISVGYSACHWCHVMEHESFEDEEVARIMNEHFICVKIDREEQPDIDSLYMSAVQIMTNQGGWPLNCFTLPDGRPIYGGTYFPKNNWLQVLTALPAMFHNELEKVEQYAAKLSSAIQQEALIAIDLEEKDFVFSELEQAVLKWSQSFDWEEGGLNRAPKFPMPSNYIFLLQYAFLSNDNKVAAQVKLTLDKMAMGGIYDQIAGGFSRYSVDNLWKVPHFEKMLYDNAQLISLYAAAFAQSRDTLYLHVVNQSLTFVEREMTHPDGVFYAALDADSEGVEGKFYVWTKEELLAILNTKEYELAELYFNINADGYWEHDNYILLKRETDEQVAQKLGVSAADLQNSVSDISTKLLAQRAKRTRPGLDDKIICSWNAMMVSAYANASRYTKNPLYLEKSQLATRVMERIFTKQDGGLYHTYKNGIQKINGFLEDYAFVIEAYLSLYQADYDEQHLFKANDLMRYVLQYFSDLEHCYCYFNSKLDEVIITRKIERSDNVIPAANSSIAKSLFLLSKYFDDSAYALRAKLMLSNVLAELQHYPPGYSNWAQLHAWLSMPFYEVVIVGEDALAWGHDLSSHYQPNVLWVASEKLSTLPIFKDKQAAKQTMAYCCYNNTCQAPMVELSQVKNEFELEDYKA